jgi:hypothetical protein
MQRAVGAPEAQLHARHGLAAARHLAEHRHDLARAARVDHVSERVPHHPVARPADAAQERRVRHRERAAKVGLEVRLLDLFEDAAVLLLGAAQLELGAPPLGDLGLCRGQQLRRIDRQCRIGRDAPQHFQATPQRLVVLRRVDRQHAHDVAARDERQHDRGAAAHQRMVPERSAGAQLPRQRLVSLHHALARGAIRLLQQRDGAVERHAHTSGLVAETDPGVRLEGLVRRVREPDDRPAQADGARDGLEHERHALIDAARLLHGGPDAGELLRLAAARLELVDRPNVQHRERGELGEARQLGLVGGVERPSIVAVARQHEHAVDALAACERRADGSAHPVQTRAMQAPVPAGVVVDAQRPRVAHTLPASPSPGAHAGLRAGPRSGRATARAASSRPRRRSGRGTRGAPRAPRRRAASPRRAARRSARAASAPRSPPAARARRTPGGSAWSRRAPACAPPRPDGRCPAGGSGGPSRGRDGRSAA